jgi:hypothetical protein
MTHCNRPSLPQQRRLAKQARKIDANHFFNLLTGPQLLEAMEAQLCSANIHAAFGSKPYS